MDGLYDQFRIALHQVWRRRWLAMAVAWGVAVLGWLVIALIPNSYEAKARLFVQTQSILPNQIGITPDERNNQLLRLKQTLTSNENLVRVVRRTDLNTLVASERDLSSVVAALRTRITITAQPDGALEIKATSNISGFSNGQNARTAAATVQGLIDLFVEQNLSGDRRETGQSLHFLDEELRRREIALQRGRAAPDGVRAALHGRASGRRHDRATGCPRRASSSPISSSRSPPPRARSTRCAASSRRRRRRMPGDRRRRRHRQRPDRAARGPAQPEPRPRLDRDRIPTSSPPRQQIARLRPYAAAERRSGKPAACPIPAYVSLRAMMAEREAQLAAATSAPQPAPVRSRPAHRAPDDRARPRRRAGAAEPRL